VGAPDPSLPRQGVFAGQAPGGLLSVYWIPGYPGPPAPGPLQRPSFGVGAQTRPKPSKEDPHEEAPHEENDDKPLRTRRPPCEGLLMRGGTRSAIAQHDPALAKG
jgi:hypothetical protein